MLKKMILSIGAGMLLVAFAAPSIASADIWTHNGVPIGESTAEGLTFDGTGELSVTRIIPGLGLVRLGPCVVHTHGTLWNSPTTGTGHGEVDSFTITTKTGTPPCHAYLNGTTICAIENAFSENTFPWTIAFSSNTALDIAGVTLTYVFNTNCPLGPGASMSGTATGQWSNAGSSISFNSSGDLKTPTGAEVFLDGSIGITPTEGGEIESE